MISSVSTQSYLTTYNISKTTQTAESTQASNQTSFTNPTAYGFNTDDNGFIDPKLNKLAGIPTSVKLHAKTLEQITTYAKNTKSDFNTVQALSKSWNFFENLVGNIDTSGKSYLTLDDIAQTPSMYTYDGTIFGKILSTAHTSSEESELIDRARVEGFSNGKLSIGESYFYGWSKWDSSHEDINQKHEERKDTHIAKQISYINKIYKKYSSTTDESIPEGKTSIGHLFGTFVHVETSNFPNGRAKEVQNYYDFLKSDDKFETYLDKTFGDGYVKKMREDYINSAQIDKDQAGAMFDYLLKEINDLNARYYNENKNYINNHKVDDFKTFDNLKLDIKQGNILDFDV